MTHIQIIYEGDTFDLYYRTKEGRQIKLRIDPDSTLFILDDAIFKQLGKVKLNELPGANLPVPKR